MDTIEQHVYKGNMQQKPQELASALLKKCWEADMADHGQPLLQREVAKNGEMRVVQSISPGSRRSGKGKGYEWEVYG
jgi:hypothetical protein